MKRLGRLRRIPWRGFVTEFVPALLFAWSFPLRDFMAQDTVVARFYELVVLFAVYALLTVGIVALCHWFLRQPWARLLAALLSIYYVMPMYFRWGAGVARSLCTVLPWLGSVIVPAAIVGLSIGLAAGLSWLVQRLRPAWHQPLVGFLRVVCVVFFAMNAGLFIQYLVRQQAAAGYRLDRSGYHKLSATAPRDIYYFVFDRYASTQSLQDYYQFDNSQFVSSLREQGFIIRDNAYSNYQYTAPSIASTLRMEYHDDMATSLANETVPSSLPYRQIIENSPVSDDLRHAGYDIINVGSWWEVTREQQQARNILPKFSLTIFNHSWILSELQTNALSETFLAPLLQGGLHIGSFQLLQLTTANQRDMFLDQVATVKALAAEPHTKPRFVFVHMLNPHPPYVFNTDGSLPSYDGGDGDSADITRAQKYVNQLQYDNSQYLEIMRDIKAKATTEPIILIQSDEGPYPIGYDTEGNLKGAYKWQDAPTKTLKEKLGVLAAYNLPSISADEAAGLNSSVNLFRFVFNKYFGTDLPLWPDCTVMFNLGDHPFTFYDVTGKLHEEDAHCPALTGAQ